MTKLWTPHATVAAIVEQDGRFLMIEEHAGFEHPVFNQPAGHIEENELIIDALRRETLEESGWHVTPKELIGIYIYRAPNGVTYHRYCILAQALHKEPNAKLDKGIIAAHWLTLEEVKSNPHLRSPLVLTSIEDYLAGKRYPLSLITEHLSWKTLQTPK